MIKEFLEFQATIKFRFTVKLVLDITGNIQSCTVHISPHNSDQSFGQFGEMVECSFRNEVLLGYSPVTVT